MVEKKITIEISKLDDGYKAEIHSKFLKSDKYASDSLESLQNKVNKRVSEILVSKL